METFANYLNRHTPQAEEIEIWGDGRYRLRVRSYLCQDVPPIECVTSIRAVVMSGNRVLVVRNRDETHILPGGRREDHETCEETVRREVLEETGWAVGNLKMIGVKHFHHLLPKPENHPYPYPDFLHVIYRANAVAYQPEARLADDYEVESQFMAVGAVAQIGLPKGQLIFLEAALQTNP